MPLYETFGTQACREIIEESKVTKSFYSYSFVSSMVTFIKIRRGFSFADHLNLSCHHPHPPKFSCRCLSYMVKYRAQDCIAFLEIIWSLLIMIIPISHFVGTLVGSRFPLQSNKPNQLGS